MNKIETGYVGEQARKELVRENREPPIAQVHLFAFICSDELMNEIAAQIEPIVDAHRSEIQGFEDFGLNLPIDAIAWIGQPQVFEEVTKRYVEDRGGRRSGARALNAGNPGDLLAALGLR